MSTITRLNPVWHRMLYRSTTHTATVQGIKKGKGKTWILDIALLTGG